MIDPHFVKITVFYYVLTVALLVRCRQEVQTRRSNLMLQIELEYKAEQQETEAKAESASAMAKCMFAEDALYSFMAAVFDVFGNLEWRTLHGADGPRLYFPEQSNAALAELLGRSVAGQPLDV